MDHRRLAAALAATLAATGSLALARPASAAGPFRSQTSVAVAMSKTGKQLLFTAGVTASLGSATGSVSFLDGHGRLLGVSGVTGCPDACSAALRVPVTKLASPESAIVAAYSGNSLLEQSSGSAPILFMRCRHATSCTQALPGPDTSLGVRVGRGSSALATIGGAALPCSLGAGQVANLATSGVRHRVTLTLYEANAADAPYYEADTATSDPSSGHSAYRCLVSTTRFLGFAPHRGSTAYTQSATDFDYLGPASQVRSGSYRGSYVGLLTDCAYHAYDPHLAHGLACENQVPYAGPVPDQVVIEIGRASCRERV